MNDIVKVDNFNDAPVYLLGVCDKYNEAVYFKEDQYEAVKYDILGLKHFYGSTIFPFPSEQFNLLLAVDNNIPNGFQLKLRIRKEDTKKEIGLIETSGNYAGKGIEFPSRFTLAAVGVPGHYSEPGVYEVVMAEDEKLVGKFNLFYTQALPLTKERIKALKSDPFSVKYVQTELACSKCTSRIKAVAGIDRKEEELSKDTFWYSELPDEFICSCGNVKINLRYWRESLHGLLGHKQTTLGENAQIERMYTKSALNEVVRKLRELIDDNVAEEVMQKFIEANPLVLASFYPELLKFKANATATYKTDFAIYNKRRELVLIEIEKPDKQLFTKSGVQHSELTQAFNQVEDWLSEARRNKLGLIDDLNMSGVKIDNVDKIKGVVIAGKNSEAYEPHMAKLKHKYTDIDFYTYDDIYNHLVHLSRQIVEI